jgi:hypothetical protein
MIITLAHKINKGRDSDCVQYFPENMNEVHKTDSCVVECTEKQEKSFVNIRKLTVTRDK